MIHTGFANKILQFVTAKTDKLSSTGKCYLGFSSTAPNVNGSNFNEPSSSTYPSYERIQLSITEALEYTDKWGVVSGGMVANATEFTSRECLEEGGWPEFFYFGIFDVPSGGVPLVSGLLRDPEGTPDPETGLYPEKSLTVEQNHVAVFRAGALQLKLS
jgi:hypothetical protein